MGLSSMSTGVFLLHRLPLNVEASRFPLLCSSFGQSLSLSVCRRCLLRFSTSADSKVCSGFSFYVLGIVFAPESPYWLVKKGRNEDAEKALMRLSTRSSGFTEEDARQQVAMMSHTNEVEKAATSGVSFMDCLRGVNLRRTEIGALAFRNSP